jgi:S-DNA-T family DNA segregation ATPase FtsK/SpoIIIE
VLNLNDIQLYICKACPTLGGKDMVTKRKRCYLCGRITDKFELPSQKKGKAGKLPKGAKRFPRELAADEEQKIIMDIITNRTRDFDCPGVVTDIRKGPMVTQYKFQPDRFTRLKKLKNLNEDLALALSADNVSVTRIPGEAAIGIAVPNKDKKEILFGETLKNVIAHRDDMELPINFGVTATGEPYVEDLTRMPHLLVAGSTGTGKSVFLNSILTSLLYIRSPKQLKLILIDPKSVELLPYKGLPHLLHDPTADVYEALGLLDRMVQEVKRRTSNLYTMGGLKNIKEYNDRVKKQAAALKTAGSSKEEVDKKLDEQWAYIVIVIDEMADIVLSQKKEFIEKMAAISAMARAAGIHVIAATQRPSVDVLSGKVKVNFPARVSFRVPSSVDSKTILSHKGAEQLLGKGDMFYISPDKSGLQRIHAPHVQQADINQMLKLSIELGHVLSVPADGLDPKVPVIAKTQKGNGKSLVQ